MCIIMPGSLEIGSNSSRHRYFIIFDLFLGVSNRKSYIKNYVRRKVRTKFEIVYCDSEISNEIKYIGKNVDRFQSESFLRKCKA